MSPIRTFSFSIARLQWLVLVVLPLALLSTACGSSDQTVPTAPTPPTGPAEMQITDVVVGTGDTLSTTNQQGTFIYTLWQYDPAGTDSKGAGIQTGPIQFHPGTTQVIPGVATGVVGMQTGGTRRLIVPPSLAYGATGGANGAIAPNAWVVFEFQLLEVRDCNVTTCQT